jgi:hypothetical protein
MQKPITEDLATKSHQKLDGVYTFDLYHTKDSLTIKNILRILRLRENTKNSTSEIKYATEYLPYLVYSNEWPMFVSEKPAFLLEIGKKNLSLKMQKELVLYQSNTYSAEIQAHRQ